MSGHPEQVHDDATFDAIAMVEAVLADDHEGLAAVVASMSSYYVAITKLAAALLEVNRAALDGEDAKVICPGAGGPGPTRR